METSIKVDNTPFSKEFKDVCYYFGLYYCCFISCSLLVFLILLMLSNVLGSSLILFNHQIWIITCGNHAAPVVLNHCYTKQQYQSL